MIDLIKTNNSKVNIGMLNKISYLENKNQALEDDRKWFIGRIKELEKDRAIRDLEQQARACCWIYSNVLDLSHRNHVAIQYRNTELLNQAKALQDQE
jgi:hypothetical protein|tara:strand:- start:2854 stop:3144 length:291 start_codon:yes stop_codon:yes gene_type:complete